MDLRQGIEKLRAIQLPTLPTINLSNVFSYSAGGIPILTYGMIGLTTVILAAVTIFDDQPEKETGAKTDKTDAKPYVMPDLGFGPESSKKEEPEESEVEESEESEDESEESEVSKPFGLPKEEENPKTTSLLPDLESLSKTVVEPKEEKPKTSSLDEDEDESRGGKRKRKTKRSKSKKQRKTKSKKLNTKK